MRKTLVLFGIVLCFARETAAQVVYNRQHDVLVAAIKSGHAEGVLAGQAAELFTKQFKSSGPLYVSADVIASYPRESCKRLSMVYTKKDVPTPNGMQDIKLNTKLNYCLDGAPPVDLEKAQ